MKYLDFVKSQKSKKGEVDNTVTSQVQFPTGFMYLDYICGSYIIPEDEKDIPLGMMYHNIGTLAGSVNMVISKSQNGKSSLVVEMALGILDTWLSESGLKRYLKAEDNPDFDWIPKSVLLYLDSEGTQNLDYIKKVSRLSNNILKNHVDLKYISTDKDLYRELNKHIAYKISCMKKVVYPIKDLYGDPIEMYPPTVVILDSVTQLTLEKLEGMDDKAYEQQMQNPAGAQRAKVISAIYTQLVIIAKKYNIVFLMVNHINKNPQMSFIPQPKQYHGLKQDETISGGERSMYLVTNILRLDRVKTIGTDKASYLNLGEGISGHVCLATFIKNKSNSLNNTCYLVYTNIRGFDPLLSLLYTAKERDEIKKSGNFLVLNKYPEFKFTLKTAHEVFAEHPEMILAMYEQFRDTCSSLLDNNPFKNDKSKSKDNEEIEDSVESTINYLDSIDFI